MIAPCPFLCRTAVHMVCCSFSCQGSYAHTVSHTTGKKSTESSGLVQIFKVLRHQQRLLNFRHGVRLCDGVFEAESNNQSVHFHHDIFCRLRVSGMLPIIHCLLITHVIILLYIVCCQVCSSSWSSLAWPWA